MNRDYALELLSMAERGMLKYNSVLAKEAYRYLLRLKSTDNDIYNRIYQAKEGRC